jgi:hypothetical protein
MQLELFPPWHHRKHPPLKGNGSSYDLELVHFGGALLSVYLFVIALAGLQ